MDNVTKDSESENPQEHPVHHHRHKLPVVFDLSKSKKPIVFEKYLTFAKKKDITTKTSQQRLHNKDITTKILFTTAISHLLDLTKISRQILHNKKLSRCEDKQ